MNFGDINHFILLGGGKLLLESAIMLKEEGVSVFVVTSERHSREIIGNNETLIESIKCNNIAHVISCEVTMDPNVIRMITEKTIGISIGAAWVFKKSFIDLFNGRLINLHPTRLPQNRGGGIFSWMALRNERTGICLIHQVDVGVDSGNIILFEEYIYPSYCRFSFSFFSQPSETPLIRLKAFALAVPACAQAAFSCLSLTLTVSKVNTLSVLVTITEECTVIFISPSFPFTEKTLPDCVTSTPAGIVIGDFAILDILNLQYYETLHNTSPPTFCALAVCPVITPFGVETMTIPKPFMTLGILSLLT